MWKKLILVSAAAVLPLASSTAQAYPYVGYGRPYGYARPYARPYYGRPYAYARPYYYGGYGGFYRPYYRPYVAPYAGFAAPYPYAYPYAPGVGLRVGGPGLSLSFGF
jgi:hypothetical protein